MKYNLFAGWGSLYVWMNLPSGQENKYPFVHGEYIWIIEKVKKQ